MIPHKHAEVLRAIADGVPLSEFEVRLVKEEIKGTWTQLSYASILNVPNVWEVRRKPQYIMVNGFKVPKPLESVPHGIVYMPSFVEEDFVDLWAAELPKKRAVKNKVAHATKEAAIAHAKAMLGIDPKWGEA